MLARFLASLVTAVVVGWIWLRLGKDSVIRMPRRARAGGSRLARFVDEVRHDVLHAGGYLVIGAAVAATVNVVVPREWIDTLAGNLLVSVIVLALFAVIVAICSEADAFVAASMSAFPMTARLVFMVVGPVLDVKLFALQVATFGRRFALLFAPLTFVVAVLVATATGMVLLCHDRTHQDRGGPRMNKSMQSTALSVIGVISVVAALGGLYLNFVKPVMRWPIIAAALLLIVVAVIGLGARERGDDGGEVEAVAPYESMDESDGHDHGRGPRVGWLLLIPFLLLGVVTPGPLGAFSAERDSGRIVTDGEAPLFEPLADGEEEVALAVGEYSMRALYDDPDNLEGRTFSLTGFASTLPSGDGWALTRMSLNCCAGDAQAIKVRVLGAPAPVDNDWVTLTGTWKQVTTSVDDPATLPVIEASNLQQVDVPANPYE